MPFTPIKTKGSFTPIEETPTGLPSINAPVTADDQHKSIAQKAAELAYTPVRGTRAIGVGLEKLLEGVKLPNPIMPGHQLGMDDIVKIIQNSGAALQSAAEATKPGYEPPPGEKLGAALGEGAGIAGLTAPLTAIAPAMEAAAGGVGEIPSVASAAIQAGVDAPITAGVSALQQKSETGKVDPWVVAQNTALAAGIPFVKPAYEAFTGAVKKYLPEVAATISNTPPKATKIFMNNKKVLAQNTGTEEMLQQRVGEVQKTLVDIRKSAQDAYDKGLSELGLSRDLDTRIDALAKAKTDKMPPDQVAQMYAANPRMDITPMDAERSLKNFSVPEIAQAYKLADKVPVSQKLKYLYGLRKAIDQQVDFVPGVVKAVVPDEDIATLKGIRGQLNKVLHSDELPGGRQLRNLDKNFSTTAGLYDDLQKKLATPGSAEDALYKIFKGDINILTKGRSHDVENALNELDRIAGKPVTKQLWDELTATYFRRVTPRGLVPALIGSGGVNAAITAAATGHPEMAALAAVGATVSSPRVLGAGIRTAQTMNPYVQKFINGITNSKIQSAVIGAITAKNKGDKK